MQLTLTKHSTFRLNETDILSQAAEGLTLPFVCVVGICSVSKHFINGTEIS